MSSTRPSWEREDTLQALPLHKPIRIRVLCDVGGISIFGLDELRGYTAAGTCYDQALSVFVDALITDYYHYYLHPSEVQTAADDAQGRRLRGFFWDKRMKDSDKEEE